MNNIKNWLKRNGLEFKEEKGALIVSSLDLQIYDDITCITLDYGDGFTHHTSNKELYKEIKEFQKS